MKFRVLIISGVYALISFTAQAHENEVSIAVKGNERCITSNGSATHDIGEFPNSENLDECNGVMSNGTYYYFATETYPFFPRCFLGTVSDDFLGRT